MNKPEEIPEDVPDEVKLVLAHLEPEPEHLAQERERLLAALEERVASSQGTLRQLLEKMQVVLLARRPGAVFHPRYAREFSEALESYKSDPSGPRSPPDILRECFFYLREHVVATGLRPLLAAVDEVSTEGADAADKAQKQQQELETRIKLGNTRG